VDDLQRRKENGSAVKIGSVVVDCNDVHKMLAFWQEALHYAPKYPPEEDWVILRDPEGRNVNVSLQKVPENRVGKNRLHFDLYTADQESEVERLLGLGATRHPRVPEPDEDFIVLADPEGNLFCVVDTSKT
jgi:hypothetical protein